MDKALNVKRVREWRLAHKKPCPECGASIYRESSSCRSCLHRKRNDISLMMTLGRYRDSVSVKGKHPSWTHAAVRDLARYMHRDKMVACMNCGYGKHVEVCHVIPLSAWPDTATIAEVNSTDNILILCRNCHWEFDHAMLDLERLRGSHQPIGQAQPF